MRVLDYKFVYIFLSYCGSFPKSAYTAYSTKKTVAIISNHDIKLLRNCVLIRLDFPFIYAVVSKIFPIVLQILAAYP